MQIIIEIQDDSYFAFMEMLRKLDYVRVVGMDKKRNAEEHTGIHYPSEMALADEWLTPEENEAWKNL